MNDHKGFATMITVLGLAIGISLLLLPSSPPLATQPQPAEWEKRAWDHSKCEVCKKSIGSNPNDGLYIIGGQGYWVHQACVRRITRGH